MLIYWFCFSGKSESKDSPETEKVEHFHPEKVKQKSKTGEARFYDNLYLLRQVL